MEEINGFLGNANLLMASLIWGSIGMGYVIYGKKQAAGVPLIGGLFMVAVSCFLGSVWGMSVVSMGLMGGVYWLVRRGY